MLKKIDGYNKYVEINGFKEISINTVEGFLSNIVSRIEHNLVVQFFDASTVASWEHLYFGLLNSLKAFENNYNLSKSVAMETLLYSSGQRQIKKAVDLIGLKNNSKNAALLLVGETINSVKNGLSAVENFLNIPPDDSVLELNPEKIKKLLKIFKISKSELCSIQNNDLKRAVVDLVIERGALLTTQL